MEDQLQNELMPNNSEAMGIYEPEVDPELAQQEQAEKAKMASAVPIFEEMLEWFDTQISAADSIQVLMTMKRARGTTLEEAMHAKDIVRGSLEVLRDDFVVRFEQFIKRDNDGSD